MPKKRQRALFDPRGRGAAQMVTLTYDYPDGHRVPEHFHEEDQLVYGACGVMTVKTPGGAWVVPTRRAVWVPARVPHAIEMLGRVTMKTLYFAPRLARGLPRTCCVLHVSPLLSALVLHACEAGSLDRRVPEQARLLAVILDQLHAAPEVPLQLPVPRDARARKVADILAAAPDDRRTLAALCERTGASKRTIERVFLEETAMTFGKWRQQLRLLHATRMLAAGAKVTTAALETGYESTSAFIAMFRRTLGTTPSKYFGERDDR
jgi:AraC-like DNA-binding protein